MAEQTLREQIQDLLKECKDDKEYYEMYDVYEVDCDDGTVGDKIFIPKNKMRNIKNK